MRNLLGLRQHPDFPQVAFVCGALRTAGFQAWLAGGCVRDGLLNRAPRDFDVATNALPDEIEGIFKKLSKKTVAVGKQFGIIVVISEDVQIEVATFRSDGNYVDGRHPTSVSFSGPREDAARRDFTINAMFYDLETGLLHDYFGGEDDLGKKIIRTVGEPQRRFEEDRLRMLRAMRFAADLDFEIDKATLSQVTEQHLEIRAVSAERQRDELVKLLKAKHWARGISLLASVGFFRLFLEFVESEKSKAVCEFLCAMSSAPVSELGRTALFFGLEEGLKDFTFSQEACERRKIRAEKLMTKFKFSNVEKNHATAILKNMWLLEFAPRPATLTRLAAEPWAKDLASAVQGLNAAGVRSPRMLAEFQKLCAAGFRLPVRWITGETLKEEGVAPNPSFGAILEEAYDLQIEEKLRSTDEAKEWLRKRLSSKT